MTQKTKTKVARALKAVAKLSERERAQLLERGIVKTIEGVTLSTHNTISLYAQGCNDAIVGGYKQWRDVGRQVRKGESGFVIRFPAFRKGRVDDENEKPRFFYATVFAQSQTDEIEMVNEPYTYRDKVEQEERYRYNQGREYNPDPEPLSHFLPENNGYSTITF